MLADNFATDAELHASAAPAGWADEVGLKNHGVAGLAGIGVPLSPTSTATSRHRRAGL